MVFDPYHKWLGIPPAEQPPNHYRLLAVALFEDDPDVIETAADQRMALLRMFQTGQHSALSQKLLNELSAARLCLLTPEKRAAYDAELRRRIDAAHPLEPAIPTARPITAAPARASMPVANAVEPAPMFVTDREPRSHATQKRRPRVGPTASAWLALASVALPAVAFVAYLIGTKPQPERTTPPSAQASLRPNKSNATLPAPQPATPPEPSTDGGQAAPPSTTPEVASADAVSDGSMGTGPTMRASEPTASTTSGPVSGFTAYDANWRVEEGEVFAPVGPGPKLVSEVAPFADGAVGVEVFLPDRAPGNAGIVVRLANPGTGADNFDGYEISLDADANMVRLARHRHDYQLLGDTKHTLPASKWIALEARITGNNIEVLVDGKSVVRYQDDERPLLTGTVALRPWLREARYRNLWVKIDGQLQELPFCSPAGDAAGQDRPSLAAGNDEVPMALARETGPIGKPVDLLTRIELARDAVKGEWELAEGVLLAKAGWQNHVQAPIDLPENYRLTAVAGRVSPSKGPGSWIAVRLRMGEHQTLFAVDNDLVDLPYAGLHWLDGQPPWENEACGHATAVADGEPAALVCTVYRERLTVEINGQRAIDWQGDPQRLSFPPEWAPREAGRVCVGADCAVHFSKLLLEPLDPSRPLDEQGEKLPVPAAQPLSRARAALKGQPQPGPKPGEAQQPTTLALAEKRLRDSCFTDDPTVRYVLLETARKEATVAGNVELAWRAIDELARVFTVDKVELELATLTEVGKAAPALIGYDAVTSLVEAAVETDRYGEALRALSLGNKAASSTKNKEWSRHWSARKSLLGRQQAGYGAVQSALEKLRSQPDDPEANLAAGKFYCLLKRDWWRGVPHLARCGDVPLKEIAARDLARPEALAAQRQLAADWWQQGQQESGDGKLAMAARAGYWYRRVYPLLSDAEKQVVRQRVREIDVLVYTGAAEPQFLSEMLEAKVVARRDWFRHGRNPIHQPIVAQGRVSRHGMLLHPPENGFSAVSYELGKKASRLRSEVAIDDVVKGRPIPLVFEVHGDGKQLWASPPLRGDQIARCDIDVSGVETLELRVVCDGHNHDAWAVWLDPRITWK